MAKATATFTIVFTNLDAWQRMANAAAEVLNATDDQPWNEELKHAAQEIQECLGQIDVAPAKKDQAQ